MVIDYSYGDVLGRNEASHKPMSCHGRQRSGSLRVIGYTSVRIGCVGAALLLMGWLWDGDAMGWDGTGCTMN